MKTLKEHGTNIPFPSFWGLRAFLSLLLVLLFIASCGHGPRSPEKNNSQEKKANAPLAQVPFYQSGSIAFTAREARLREEERKKAEERREERHRKNLEEDIMTRFSGMVGNYWISPPRYPPLVAALEVFPKDAYGYPDWSKAVRKGLIKPKGSLNGTLAAKEDPPLFNGDIIFEINDRMMANVRFPHEIHNYWLSCDVCHPKIFIPQKGANNFGMTDIWNGEYCGRCHGKVAYAPKGFSNCIRCHSVKRERVYFTDK